MKAANAEMMLLYLNQPLNHQTGSFHEQGNWFYKYRSSKDIDRQDIFYDWTGRGIVYSIRKDHSLLFTE